jgi:hypothetical protein
MKLKAREKSMSQFTAAWFGLAALAAATVAQPASAQTVLFEGARVIPAMVVLRSKRHSGRARHHHTHRPQWRDRHPRAPRGSTSLARP